MQERWLSDSQAASARKASQEGSLTTVNSAVVSMHINAAQDAEPKEPTQAVHFMALMQPDLSSAALDLAQGLALTIKCKIGEKNEEACDSPANDINRSVHAHVHSCNGNPYNPESHHSI